MSFPSLSLSFFSLPNSLHSTSVFDPQLSCVTPDEARHQTRPDRRTDRQINTNGNGKNAMKQKLQEIVKMPLTPPPPPTLLGPCLKASPTSCSIFALFTVLRYLASSKGFPLLPPTWPVAHFMFLDELKSRMQIKFACLYCCPMCGDPGPRHQDLSLLCCLLFFFLFFYISIEPCSPSVFIPPFSVLFDFKVFSILWVFFERDSVIHIYFISFLNDDVLCQ